MTACQEFSNWQPSRKRSGLSIVLDRKMFRKIRHVCVWHVCADMHIPVCLFRHSLVRIRQRILVGRIHVSRMHISFMLRVGRLNEFTAIVV
jgi:hypothetical protein